MKQVVEYLKARRDFTLLLAAFILLIAAAFKPSIPLPRNVYSYVFVADISQSMNAVDATLNGKPVTRIAQTQYMLHNIVANMPCGTHVSVALFAGSSIAPLYNPIEVCSNYAAIQDTIEHLDWRSAWSGNSRVRDSLFSLARALRAFPEPAQVVYFSDGEEAPKLHVFNTKDLTNFQGGGGWLFVGVGSDKGAAIPKLDDKNQTIGFWSADSFAIQPGMAQISAMNIGGRDDSVASATGDRYISKRQDDYMQDVAKQVGGDYVRGDSLQSVLSAMKKQKPARRDIAAYEIQSILASLAGLLLIAAYVPKKPVQAFGTWAKGLIYRRRKS